MQLDPVPCSTSKWPITFVITYRAKLLNVDWFRQRNNFPSIEGKITRCWLAEKQNLLASDWLTAPFLHLVGFLKSFAQNFLTRDRFWLLNRLIPLKSMEIRRKIEENFINKKLSLSVSHGQQVITCICAQGYNFGAARCLSVFEEIRLLWSSSSTSSLHYCFLQVRSTANYS